MISERRRLLNQLLRKHEYFFCGDVLDIGGKRNHNKGGYTPPVGRVNSWEYLNPDPSTAPDYLCQTENIPLPSDSKDTVVMIETLEYLSQPQLALNEIFRILKPGGVFILSSPMLFPIHGDPNLDLFRHSKKQIENELRESGFREISISPMGSVGAVFFDILFVVFTYSSHLRPLLLRKTCAKLLETFRFLFQLIDKVGQQQQEYITGGYFVACKKPHK